MVNLAKKTGILIVVVVNLCLKEMTMMILYIQADQGKFL